MNFSPGSESLVRRLHRAFFFLREKFCEEKITV